MIAIQIILYIVLLAVIGRVRIVNTDRGVALIAKTTYIVWTLAITGCLAFWVMVYRLIMGG